MLKIQSLLNPKCFFLLFFCIFATLSLSGQVVFVGQLKDSLSNENMPYASIAIKEQDSILNFVYSNEKGDFENVCILSSIRP